MININKIKLRHHFIDRYIFMGPRKNSNPLKKRTVLEKFFPENFWDNSQMQAYKINRGK